MASLQYLEEVDDRSVSTFGFSPEGGRAVGAYQLQNPSYIDLINAINELIGYVDTSLPYTTSEDGTKSPDKTRRPYGRLRRVLPKAHPVFPWLYFSGVLEARGMGGQTHPPFTRQLPNVAPANAAPIADFALYKTYVFKCEFKPRFYSLVPDNTVPTKQGTYYDGRTPDAVTPFGYPEEWLRYTDFDQKPTGNFATALQGTMKFQGGAADGKMYPDAPRVLLPDQTKVFTWYQVPYRFVTSPNSYFNKFIGCVNQNTWNNHPPGSLLFLGASPQKYQPAVQLAGISSFNIGNVLNQIVPGFPDVEFTFSTLDTAKVCNVDLNFLLTTRLLGSDSAPIVPVNKNWVAAGFNLQPYWQTRKFYYPHSFDPASPADQSKWHPTFSSAPFELLFTDPDYPQVDPATGAPVNILPPE